LIDKKLLSPFLPLQPCLHTVVAEKVLDFRDGMGPVVDHRGNQGGVGFSPGEDIEEMLRLSRLTLETKRIAGLYLAGQTTGPRATRRPAAQGLWAGINAALAVQGRPPFVLDRSEAYMGVIRALRLKRSLNQVSLKDKISFQKTSRVLNKYATL
jgi:hypothetical protein